jgi:DNA-binding MarR family transcriptional regulator
MHEDLSRNEKKVLYYMFKHPLLNNRELAQEIGMNQSTIASIRQRLYNGGYFRTVRIPVMQNLGCELLVAIHTDFNPAIPLEQRVKTTKKMIEVFDEIFYSIGETNKGFSFSLAGNYTATCKINDVRTETFAKMNLLEGTQPTEAVFPFTISRINRFMDFAPMLADAFGIEDAQDASRQFVPGERVELGKTEKLVYLGLVENPEMTDTELGKTLPVSRHTVAAIRKRLEGAGLIKTVLVPDMRKLGFKVICFYHIRYSTKKPLDMAGPVQAPVMNNNTFFMASRKYETIMLSAYRDYDEAKMDSVRKVQYLKENGLIDAMPVIQEYSVNNMAMIKDLAFAQITKKILGI